jgi:hypothetical protein
VSILTFLLAASLALPEEVSPVQTACGEATMSCGTTCLIQGCDGGENPCHIIECKGETKIYCGKSTSSEPGEGG